MSPWTLAMPLPRETMSALDQYLNYRMALDPIVQHAYYYSVDQLLGVSTVMAERNLEAFDQWFMEHVSPDLYHDPIYSRCTEVLMHVAQLIMNVLKPMFNPDTFNLDYDRFDAISCSLLLSYTPPNHP